LIYFITWIDIHKNYLWELRHLCNHSSYISTNYHLNFTLSIFLYLSIYLFNLACFLNYRTTFWIFLSLNRYIWSCSLHYTSCWLHKILLLVLEKTRNFQFFWHYTALVNRSLKCAMLILIILKFVWLENIYSVRIVMLHSILGSLVEA